MVRLRQPLIILIIITGIAILLRVAVALYLGDIVDAPALLQDQRSYHALGARLITGHGFSFDAAWYPFTPPDTPTAHWSFLYSLFVAGVYAIFGVHPLAARLVEAVLGGILLPAMAFLLARRFFGDWGPRAPGEAVVSTPGAAHRGRISRRDRLALLTAGSFAVYAYFVLYSATLMTETFFVVGLLWSFERALALRQQMCQAPARIQPSRALTLGLSLGLTTLLRQSVLPWVLVLYAWLFWVGLRSGQGRNAIRALALSLVPIALCVLPFTVRNYQTYDSFLLLNSNAGYAMYSAQHPMHGTQFQAFAAAPLPDMMGHFNEAQLDRELMRLGIGFVVADPGRYLLLSLSRVGAYFDFWPGGATSLLNALGRTVSFTLLLPFMVYGLWIALRQIRAEAPEQPGGSDGVTVLLPAPGKQGATLRRSPDASTSSLALLVLFVVVYSAMHVLTWAMPRYRLPVDAVMLMFVALAVDVLIGRSRLGRRFWPQP